MASEGRGMDRGYWGAGAQMWGPGLVVSTFGLCVVCWYGRVGRPGGGRYALGRAGVVLLGQWDIEVPSGRPPRRCLPKRVGPTVGHTACHRDVHVAVGGSPTVTVWQPGAGADGEMAGLAGLTGSRQRRSILHSSTTYCLIIVTRFQRHLTTADNHKTNYTELHVFGRHDFARHVVDWTAALRTYHDVSVVVTWPGSLTVWRGRWLLHVGGRAAKWQGITLRAPPARDTCSCRPASGGEVGPALG